MIWSSLARNRSPDPVVLCFFGRIATSDATTESCLAIRRNPENEIARFRCPKHQNPAIAKQSTKTNAILAQSLSRSSRTTSYGDSHAGRYSVQQRPLATAARLTASQPLQCGPCCRSESQCSLVSL